MRSQRDRAADVPTDAPRIAKLTTILALSTVLSSSITTTTPDAPQPEVRPTDTTASSTSITTTTPEAAQPDLRPGHTTASSTSITTTTPEAAQADRHLDVARGVGALDDSGGPRVTVIGANDAQRASLDESLEQFRLHRLALPELQVRFSDDPGDCNGHLGGFRRGVVPWRIVVCSDLDFVIAHELAHAWSAANLDDERRQRYTAARGLPTWDDHDVPWEQRGIEDAAFVVQQNLMVRRSKPSLSSPTWRDRAEAYELLTGNRSPLRTP